MESQNIDPAGYPNDVSSPEPNATTDLRRARRERGMNAVIDTAVEVFVNGEEYPTASEIAERSGVSTSSLFRYFASIDDLRDRVAERYIEQHRDLLESDLPDGANFEQRTRAFVDLRIRAGATLGPMNRRLQRRMTNEPGLKPIRARFRSILTGQVEAHFDAELAALTTARRADLIALLDSMTSIEAFQILHENHDRTETQIRRTWLGALQAILPTAPTPDVP